MKWEYLLAVLDPAPPGGDTAGAEAYERQLNVLGQDAWELVTVTLLDRVSLAYLKRPVSPQ
jgi:hypothetical protein